MADPPEYKVPGQTRPVLNQFKAAPDPSKVLVVYTGRTGMAVGTLFSVPVRSEDAGEDLRAILFLDYQVPPSPDSNSLYRGEDVLSFQRVPASTYADTSGRPITYPWLPDGTVAAGCHFITLIVAHEGSFQQGDQRHLDAAKASEDAAFLTWTVNVDPVAGAVNDLINCPTSASGPQ